MARMDREPGIRVIRVIRGRLRFMAPMCVRWSKAEASPERPVPGRSKLRQLKRLKTDNADHRFRVAAPEDGRTPVWATHAQLPGRIHALPPGARP